MPDRLDSVSVRGAVEGNADAPVRHLLSQSRGTAGCRGLGETQRLGGSLCQAQPPYRTVHHISMPWP